MSEDFYYLFVAYLSLIPSFFIMFWDVNGYPLLVSRLIDVLVVTTIPFLYVVIPFILDRRGYV